MLGRLIGIAPLIREAATATLPADPLVPSPDACVVGRRVLAVCEAIGHGPAAAELTAMAAAVIAEHDDDEHPGLERLAGAVEDAARVVRAAIGVGARGRGLGCGLTAVQVVGGRLMVVSIGPTCCYVLRAGEMVRVTEDETVALPSMQCGDTTALQWLGMSHVAPQTLDLPLERGDTILLATGTLLGGGADGRIMHALGAGGPVGEVAAEVTRCAWGAPPPGDISVVVARAA